MELSFLMKALDAAAVGAMITDRSGTIEWVSSGFTRISGYAAQEAIGKNPRILKSSAHTPSFYSQLWQTILSGRPGAARSSTGTRTGSRTAACNLSRR